MIGNLAVLRRALELCFFFFFLAKSKVLLKRSNKNISTPSILKTRRDKVKL